ncbi:hypothetical protein AVDCRST_MAG94-1807 [uncultured Leptolyngbya sp.]|uniref:Uncharacterized protein n=1 Tax=uncultured Leptolyngbya sp. TaxID=332963 RepID=A0A6J4LHL5_9CYAN|nr:hypothetical protein AVDCRST_MAG94-1807 [uncultured Leptolyngbya sp.]
MREMQMPQQLSGTQSRPLDVPSNITRRGELVGAYVSKWRSCLLLAIEFSVG